jgi:hypothetical protein
MLERDIDINIQHRFGDYKLDARKYIKAINSFLLANRKEYSNIDNICKAVLYDIGCTIREDKKKYIEYNSVSNKLDNKNTQDESDTSTK